MKNKLWKLAQMLIQFKKYVTDNGVLVIDGDLAEGVEVSVENENGDLEPAADGEYELGDNLKISVADGKVTQIVEEKEEEPIEEPTEEPEPMAEEPTEEPNNEPDEKDLRIEELEGLLKDRDAIIEELTAKIKELEEEIAKPVEEPVKMAATVQEKNTPQSGALKYFQK